MPVVTGLGKTSDTSDWGSWTQYGWRVGPDPTTAGASPNLGLYGQGMPYAPIFTYFFKPGEELNVNNVCPARTMPGPGFLALITTVGTNKSVVPYWTSPFVPTGPTPNIVSTQKSAAGTLALQFQYPQVVSVLCSALTPVTVFGYDWYMQPMQENIVSSFGGVFGKKAFYGITGVWVKASTGVASISVRTAGVYGLPYSLVSNSGVISYAENGALPTALTNVPTPALSVDLVSTATSVDVRGVFTPNTVPGPTSTQVLTYYVNGASAWQSMIAGISQGNNPSRKPWLSRTATANEAPTIRDLYGVPQYYVGYPT